MSRHPNLLLLLTSAALWGLVACGSNDHGAQPGEAGGSAENDASANDASASDGSASGGAAGAGGSGVGAGGSLIGMTGVGGDSTRCKPTSCAEQKIGCGSIPDNSRGDFGMRHLRRNQGVRRQAARLRRQKDRVRKRARRLRVSHRCVRRGHRLRRLSQRPTLQWRNGPVSIMCEEDLRWAMRKDRRWLRRRALVRYLRSGAHL